jgi:hypothetical protein
VIIRTEGTVIISADKHEVYPYETAPLYFERQASQSKLSIIKPPLLFEERGKGVS